MRLVLSTDLSESDVKALNLANYVTANERKAMSDAHIEPWVDRSVEWFHRNFGKPAVDSKPYEMIPGLISADSIPGN